MLTSDERIRRNSSLDHKSIRHRAREGGRSRRTVDQAIADPPSPIYHLTRPKPAPILGPFQARIEDLLRQSERLPPKQRYTAQKLFQLFQAEGEQAVNRASGKPSNKVQRARHKQDEVFFFI